SKLTRSVTRGFAKVEPTTNVLVAYAAKDGTTAKDGDRRNSPYTTALLRNLEVPGLEISYMFRNVRDEVMASTHRAQQPFVYGSLSSKAVYLKPAASPPDPAALQRVAPLRAPRRGDCEAALQLNPPSAPARGGGPQHNPAGRGGGAGAGARRDHRQPPKHGAPPEGAHLGRPRPLPGRAPRPAAGPAD